ncbi:hypothetical protein P8452_59779 [Trifolium repens]|nr:hypothetical protein P8452_59779 [Trifolium repens]
MASHTYQSCICWILCFAFILLSGFTTSFADNSPFCLGNCIDVHKCNQNCLANGFKNSYCVEAVPNFLLCCCGN